MAKDFNFNKSFSHPYTDTYQSAFNSAKALNGKILKNDEKKGVLHIQFDKKLYGKYLGDRSRFEIQFSNDEGAETTLAIQAYAVNPVGQKLMFGQRKGVIPAVTTAFFAEIEKRLAGEA